MDAGAKLSKRWILWCTVLAVFVTLSPRPLWAQEANEKLGLDAVVPGALSVTNIDIGEVLIDIADLEDGRFVFSYEFARGTDTSEIVLQDDLSLEVTTMVDFTEESGIEDRTTISSFQNSLELSGILAYIGTWVNDQPEEAEYSYLSIALVDGELVIFGKAIIDGQEHDFGQFDGDEDIDDGSLAIYFDYPGGGLITGTCVPGDNGSLIVEMFAEHMVDDVHTTHESVITMRRVD